MTHDMCRWGTTATQHRLLVVAKAAAQDSELMPRFGGNQHWLVSMVLQRSAAKRRKGVAGVGTADTHQPQRHREWPARGLLQASKVRENSCSKLAESQRHLCAAGCRSQHACPDVRFHASQDICT